MAHFPKYISCVIKLQQTNMRQGKHGARLYSVSVTLGENNEGSPPLNFALGPLHTLQTLTHF